MTSLPWRRTWPDTPDDGCVDAKHLLDPLDTMRVMRRDGGPQTGRWWWTISRFITHDDGVKRPRALDGYEPTKEAAREAAERVYFGTP